MKEPIGTGGSCSMATECSPPGRWSFERLANHRLVRLEGAVNLPVRVRSWESPESHVAGSRCSRVTGGGEAVYPFRGGGGNRQCVPLRESCSVGMVDRKGEGGGGGGGGGEGEVGGGGVGG